MNNVASARVEVAASEALQTATEGAQRRHLARARHLHPTQVLEEQDVAVQAAAIAERQLLSLLRSGQVRQARALLAQVAEAHAKVRALSEVAPN